MSTRLGLCSPSREKPADKPARRSGLMPVILTRRPARTAGGGPEPSERETYENDVRKAIVRDPDGDEYRLIRPPGSCRWG